MIDHLSECEGFGKETKPFSVIAARAIDFDSFEKKSIASIKMGLLCMAWIAEIIHCGMAVETELWDKFGYESEFTAQKAITWSHKTLQKIDQFFNFKAPLKSYGPIRVPSFLH